MTADISIERLYLGTAGEPPEEFTYDGNRLTTHGVIVGMTGSGKTGLGFDLIEEALLNKVPVLVIDPKGDMGNLVLTFPDLRPEDLAPWVDAGEAATKGITVEALAAEEAAKLQKRMNDAGIGAERIRRLAESTEVSIYTPGSSAGVSLNILGSLAAPGIDWAASTELLRDEIEAFVSSLLVLADIDSDPVSGAPHILLSTIIESFWSQGRDLDLATLIGLVPRPPFRKLGVFDLDAFFPEKERTKLAMRLNGLLASPSFSSWIEGSPLDIEVMLGGETTKAAVIYLAHLGEKERQFAVTLILSKLVTWFRGKSGSEGLRALVYMDEAYGYVPPTAEPPSKRPILTILKQARAFGVGMVLATQNPVDLDYKALSNAGTWLIGRLQTENDRRRILEGMAASEGGIDIAGYSDRISSLAKRQFLLSDTREKAAVVFEARRSMSYRAGPFTKEQVSSLMASRKPETTTTTEGAPTAAPSTDGQSETVPVAPTVAEGISVSYLDPAAGWAGEVGADPTSTRFEPAMAVTVDLLYDDTAAKLTHTERYEAVVYPIAEPLDPAMLKPVDHDPRDFRDEGPDGATYGLTEARLHVKGFWTSAQSAIRDYLVANRPIVIHKNQALGVYSRVGESAADFEERCRQLARESADSALVALRDRYAARIDRIKGTIAKSETRVRELEAEASAKGQQELMGGAGDLLGALIGGKVGSNPLGEAAKRRSETAKARGRAEVAQEALTEDQRELAVLEDELADEISRVTGEQAGYALDITEVEIPLEKSDVRIVEIRLVWVPK